MALPFHLAEQDPGNGSFAALMRVKPNTAAELVADAVSAAGRLIDERDHQSRGVRLYPVGLHADLVAPVRPTLFALGLTGVFLVLVLTVNLASLLLARAADQEREFAVSRAVGANGVAIVRAILIEGALLGILGGAAGALAGTWGTRLLVALAPLDLPRRESIALDWTVAVQIIGLGGLLGLVAAAILGGAGFIGVALVQRLRPWRRPAGPDATWAARGTNCFMSHPAHHRRSGGAQFRTVAPRGSRLRRP